MDRTDLNTAVLEMIEDIEDAEVNVTIKSGSQFEELIDQLKAQGYVLSDFEVSVWTV